KVAKPKTVLGSYIDASSWFANFIYSASTLCHRTDSRKLGIYRISVCGFDIDYWYISLYLPTIFYGVRCYYYLFVCALYHGSTRRFYCRNDFGHCGGAFLIAWSQEEVFIKNDKQQNKSPSNKSSKPKNQEKTASTV